MSYKGRPEIRQALQKQSELVTVFGHCYWSEPLW